MPTKDKVDQLIQNFAQQLQAAIRDQLSADVTAAVQAALGGAQPKRGAVKVNGAVKRAGAKRSAGGKRTPEEIDKLANQLQGYIEKNPEQRSEQIAEANKVTTGELVLPIKRLLAEKKIKAKGKARGTTYTAVK
jgi:hypothetical protein